MNSYFYIDAVTKQQCGPFSVNELQAKVIARDTMVWCSGMADWSEAGTIQELAFIFTGAQAPSADVNASQTVNNIPASNNPSRGQYNNSGYNNANNPNNAGGISDTRPMPKNWLVESILVTVLCCLPFGIAGIMSATKVESLYYMGDYEGAERASKDAKKWTIIGFCSTFVLGILYVLFFVILGVASAF